MMALHSMDLLVVREVALVQSGRLANGNAHGGMDFPPWAFYFCRNCVTFLELSLICFPQKPQNWNSKKWKLFSKAIISKIPILANGERELFAELLHLAYPCKIVKKFYLVCFVFLYWVGLIPYSALKTLEK